MVPFYFCQIATGNQSPPSKLLGLLLPTGANFNARIELP
jgi:hypothetical protein